MLVCGLRRLRLGAMRRLAPELLVTAKTQRWSPEEFLRTLIEAEIAARDDSNAKEQLKTAGFPVTKTVDEFDLAASSVKPPTFDYLRSLEWITAQWCSAAGDVGPSTQGICSLRWWAGERTIDVSTSGGRWAVQSPGRSMTSRPVEAVVYITVAAVLVVVGTLLRTVVLNWLVGPAAVVAGVTMFAAALDRRRYRR